MSALGWQALEQKQAFFISSGSSPSTALMQAQASITATMQREAAIMAYNDVFLTMTAFLVIAALLILSMKD